MTVMLIVLTSLLRRRGTIRANVLVADSHLAVDHPDVYAANQIIHLWPLADAEMIEHVRAANPFVGKCYPNSGTGPVQPSPVDVRSRSLAFLKRAIEAGLAVPSPLVERVCRAACAWHLRRHGAVSGHH